MTGQNNNPGRQGGCRPGTLSIHSTASWGIEMKSFKASFNTRGSRLPVISIFMTLISLILYLCGDTTAFLQYDRTLIADGELWRCITGHWIHWSFEHFLWCTITFVVLGSICELLDRRGFILSLSVSAFIIPLVCWFADPEMLLYRGLSGICSSIFMVGSILMIRKALADKDWINFFLPTAGGILFFVKTLYEFIIGQTVFVHSNNMFSPVPLAHLAGAIVGLATVVFILSQTAEKQIS